MPIFFSGTKHSGDSHGATSTNIFSVKVYLILYCVKYFITSFSFNPFMLGGKEKVIHTKKNLYLNAQRLAAGLFKYV